MLKFPRKALDAEAVAIQALGFIASDPEQLGRFLAETGIGPETLRDAAAQPGFLAQVLRFIGTSDNMVMAFAANAGLPPEAVARAVEALSKSSGSAD